MDILLNLIILFSVAQSKILAESNVQNSNVATEPTFYTSNEEIKTNITAYENINDTMIPKSLNSSENIYFGNITLASVHNTTSITTDRKYQRVTDFINEIDPEGETFFAETGDVLMSDEENGVGPKFLNESFNSAVFKNDSTIMTESRGDPELEFHPDTNENSRNISIIQNMNSDMMENLNGNNSSSDINEVDELKTEESIRHELKIRNIVTVTPSDFESDEEVFIEVISADKVKKRINSSSVQLMMDNDQFEQYNESNTESFVSKQISTVSIQENNDPIDMHTQDTTSSAMEEVITLVPETTIITGTIKEFVSTESSYETLTSSKNSSFRMLTDPNITESDAFNELYDDTTPKRFSDDVLPNNTTLNIVTKLLFHFNNEPSAEERNHSDDSTLQEAITRPHVENNFIYPLHERNFSYSTAKSDSTTYFTTLKTEFSIELNHSSAMKTETSDLITSEDSTHISMYPNATMTDINQTLKTSLDFTKSFNTAITSVSSNTSDIGTESLLFVTTTAIEHSNSTESTKAEVLPTTVRVSPETSIHFRPMQTSEENKSSTKTIKDSSEISTQSQDDTVFDHVIFNTTKEEKPFVYPLDSGEVDDVTMIENETLLYSKSIKQSVDSTVILNNETSLKSDRELSTSTLLLSTKNSLTETQSSKPISADVTTSFNNQLGTTRIFTSQKTLRKESSTTETIEDPYVNETVSIRLQKPTYIATFVDNLNKRDKMDAITARFSMSTENYNKELSISLFVTWLMQTIVQDVKNRSMNWSFEDLGIQVHFINPTPQICDNQMIFSFIVKSSKTNETLSADVLMPLLVSDKERISNKLNASGSHFSYGLYMAETELKNASILENLQAMIIISGIVVIIILLCVAIGIAVRCKKKRSILYLSDTTMFRKDMNLPTDMGSVNAAMEFDNSVSSKDCPETLPRYSTYNGFQLPSVDDNEGWIVPMGQKPEKDLNAPPIQDTPM